MKDKLDILILSDNNLETVGGEQESTKIILDNLRNEFKMGIIQPGKIKTKLDNLDYYCLSDYTRIKHIVKNPVAFFSYIISIGKIINRTSPKIIHTQAQISFFIVSLLKRIRVISKDIKLIHTERGLYEKYNKFFRFIFFESMKYLNTLVTTTNFNSNSWNQALTSKKIELNYVVISNTAGKMFEVYDYAREKDVDDNFTVGFSGRYTEWKNWPLAVDISKKLKEKLNNNVKIKMAVGCLDEESKQETEKMFKYLENIFGDKFEGEINITLEEMNNFYYDLDLFILTSKYNTESFGRTLVEAMSRKTAVLTTNAGGSVEVVGDDAKVLNTSEEFVERALYYYNNPERLEIEKLNNMKLVKEKYSLESNIQQHKDLYRKLI